MGASASLTAVYLTMETSAQLSAEMLNFTPPPPDFDKRIYFSWENNPAYFASGDKRQSEYYHWIPLAAPTEFSWPSAKPDSGPWVGYAKVVNSTGALAMQKVDVEFDSRPHVDSNEDGWFVWGAGMTPMIVMILPGQTVLEDASPVPDGVWRKEDRICCFWRAPEYERDISFKLLAVAEADQVSSQTRNVQFWQRKIKRNIQNRFSEVPGKLSDPHVLRLIAGATLGIIAVCIILIFTLGTTLTVLWVTLGVAFITALLTAAPLLSARTGYTSRY